MTACFSTRHSTVTAVLNFHFSLPFFFLFYFSVFKTVALEFSLNTHTHTHTHTRSRLKGVKHEVTSHFLPLCSFPFFFFPFTVFASCTCSFCFVNSRSDTQSRKHS